MSPSLLFLSHPPLFHQFKELKGLFQFEPRRILRILFVCLQIKINSGPSQKKWRKLWDYQVIEVTEICIYFTGYYYENCYPQFIMLLLILCFLVVILIGSGRLEENECKNTGTEKSCRYNQMVLIRKSIKINHFNTKCLLYSEIKLTAYFFKVHST